MKELLKKIFKIDAKVVGVNRRNRSLIYTQNKRTDYIFADDKELTKTFLENEHVPIPETYAVIEQVGEIREVWQKMNKYNSLAIKPARGKGGGGILVVKRLGENSWAKYSGRKLDNHEIERHIANILFGVYSFGQSDKAILEYCIDSHPFFTEIFPEGVPDIRVIALKEEPLVAMLRLPTKQSDGKANLHQGALGVQVDFETGVMGQAYNYTSYLDYHPDTNAEIKGKQVPYWKEVVEITHKIVKVSPLKYLGIDIVIDAVKGPLVLELNVRPGIEIQNVSKLGLLEIISNKNIKL